MPTRQIRLADPRDLGPHLRAARRELGIPGDFPPDTLAEAARAAEGLPASHAYDDARHLDLVTIDPPSSLDLDQALHLARDGAGFVVHYAIADVAAFVRPGGALDTEAHRRGVTVYGPDGRSPLHPPALAEGAASLLPRVDRPACLWRLRLDGDGRLADVDVRRAVVRSRAKLAYEDVQREIDSPRPDPMLALLAEIGPLRAERERLRGGVSLPIPDQEVVREPGGLSLAYRAPLPVEAWNAQISLATGIAAARLMREAGVGILRTLDAPLPRDTERLRRTAAALGLAWPAAEPYADLVRRLDAGRPSDAALLDAAASLFRNAAYRTFGVAGDGVDDDGARPPRAEALPHAAIAAEYAHVTAPLRRLVDRHGLEICLAVRAGRAVPDWVLADLPALPATMARAAQRAGAYERAGIEMIEAALLQGRVGEEFAGVVVDVRRGDPDRGEVVLAEPAVRAVVVGDGLPLGTQVRVRLDEASVAQRRVRFTLASPPTLGRV